MRELNWLLFNSGDKEASSLPECPARPVNAQTRAESVSGKIGIEATPGKHFLFNVFLHRFLPGISPAFGDLG